VNPKTKLFIMRSAVVWFGPPSLTHAHTMAVFPLFIHDCRSKVEPNATIGQMQAVGYMCRYCGNIIGYVLGTVVYNKEEFGWGLDISHVLAVNGLAAVVFIFPFMYHLGDPHSHEEIRPLRVQLADLWKMVQLRSVYRPMAFIAVYNMLMIPNAAWSNFLILGKCTLN